MMITEKRIHQLIAVLLALLALTLITAIGKNVAGLNATTVAFLYLVVVLTVSALADLASGIVTAVASGLLVNFYFLPPFGTFYITAPEDWVSFVAYTVTAVVVSYFAATVRQRAMEADHLQAQLSRLCRFTESVLAVRKEELTLEIVVTALRKAYELRYCSIYLHGETGTATPVASGTRPARSSQDEEEAPKVPRTLLEVMAEEGSDVRCLTLKDQGATVGALVISEISLSPPVAEAIAALVSLAVRHSVSVPSTGRAVAER